MMEKTKILLNLIAIIVFAGFLQNSDELGCEQSMQKVYIKSVRCVNFSSKYFYPNVTCYAKSFNRTCSTFTIIGKSINPINNFTVSRRWLVESFVKSYDRQQVASTTNMEWFTEKLFMLRRLMYALFSKWKLLTTA